VTQPAAPEEEESSRPRSPYLSIVLAFLLAAAVFIGLFFLTLGAVGPMLLIAGGVFLLAALHYLVWGWWLSRLIRQDTSDEED
jgi:Flp pilus assembly protein TadB